MDVERKLNFTQRWIEALPVPVGRRAMYYDTKVRGLVLKIEPSGTRTFAWYRKVNARPLWVNIGELSLDEARAHAEEKNVIRERWKATQYEGPSPFQSVTRTALTLDALVDDYVEKRLKGWAKNPEYAAKHLKWFVARYLSDLRQKKIASINRDEIEALHAKLASVGQRTANGAVQTLKTLFNFALRSNPHLWGGHGQNPARGHDLFPRVQRDRYLLPDELAKLWSALKRSKSADLRDFVNLALWTGARKMDVLSMRWQDVSLDDNRWTIPNPKNRKPYIVPLTTESVAILRARLSRAERQATRDKLPLSPFAFPSHSVAGHVVQVDIAWGQLLKDAGLDYPESPERRPRIHDLRRTAASYMAAQGSSLPIIGKALGHVGTSATQIYARLDLDPVRSAMTQAQRVMREAMQRKALPARSKSTRGSV